LGSAAAGRAHREFRDGALEPHGGDLAGFILLRGTREQLDSARNDEDFRRRVARAGLIVERLGVVQATLGDGLLQLMSLYREVADEAS